MTYRVGVDIGGTFTDLCAFNEKTNELHTLKVLSTPDRPGSEVMEGVRQLEARYGVKPDSISYFTHGTTVGVNSYGLATAASATRTASLFMRFNF